MSQVVDGHLGGYLPEGDPATYLPSVWQWAVDELAVSSVLDVGCGAGVAVDWFERAGCTVLGIDGMPQEGNSIVRHDYAEGPYRPEGNWDLAWCCEFVEHVASRYVRNFVATFRQAELVLMTHAEPGQPGHHHVNCRQQEYWEGVMDSAGFWHDTDLTAEARDRARENGFTWSDPDGTIRRNHFLRSGLAFRRLP